MKTTRLLPPLLLLTILLASCTSSPPPPQSKRNRLVNVATAVGDPLVQVHGYALVQEHAPELLPTLDGDGNKVITLEEVRAAAERIDEVTAALLLAQVVSRLVAKG